MHLFHIQRVFFSFLFWFDNTIDDNIKIQELYTVRFKKSNGFKNFIDSEEWTTKLAVFDSMMKHVSSKENPNGALSKQAALRWGLRLNDEQYNLNKAWCNEEKKEEAGEGAGDEGGGDEGGAPGGMPGMPGM